MTMESLLSKLNVNSFLQDNGNINLYADKGKIKKIKFPNHIKYFGKRRKHRQKKKEVKNIYTKLLNFIILISKV